MSQLKYEMFCATDIGSVRTTNEDSLKISPQFNLAVVADGMGGHKGGDIASRMAVNSLCNFYEEQLLANGTEASGEEGSRNFLLEGLSLANSEVYTSSQRLSHCEGMGTTLIATLFKENTVQVAHIGDSRLYRFSQGGLEQLSTDHTLAEELMSEGSDTPIPPYSHHVLRKALGIEASCAPDYFVLDVNPGDIFLMCSDGLTGVLSDENILTILSLRAQKPESCLKSLIEGAVDGGGHDNISVILVYAKTS